MSAYEVIRYAADGHGGEQGDGRVEGSYDTLDEAREAVAELIEGTLDDARWDGTDGDIEAYHESGDEGCGGWSIRESA